MTDDPRLLAELYDPLADATLRFRERDEVARLLMAAGFEVVEVRDGPDRPGGELVVSGAPPRLIPAAGAVVVPPSGRGW